MWPRSIAVRIGVALVMLAASVARAETVNLAPTGIRFAPPEGFCLLQPDRQAADQVLFDAQAKAIAGQNELLAMVAECAELKAWRSGEAPTIRRYGLLMAPLDAGQLAPIPGLSRLAFLDSLERRTVSIDPSLLGELAADAVHRVLPDLAAGDVRDLGMLQRSPEALYSALLGSYEHAGATFWFAGVQAFTVLQDYVVVFTLYDAFADGGTVSRLLAEQERFIPRLIALNADRAPQPWLHWALAAAAGVVGGTIIALLIARRRRQHG